MRTELRGAHLAAALLALLSACGRDGFMAAASRGDLAAVQDFVSHGEDVNRHGVLGMTALHCAARGGHVDVMKFLLDHGAKVDGREALGLTPLMVSVQNGRPESVRLPVERGADVNAMTTRGESVEQAARRANHPEFAALLIAAQKTADQAQRTRQALEQAEKTKTKNHCPSNLYFLGRGVSAQKCVDACPPGSVLSTARESWLPGKRLCIVPTTGPVPLLR